MSCRKRSCEEDNSDTIYKKKRCLIKNSFIYNKNDTSVEEKIYTQADVTALLSIQEQSFRIILEEKLKEQFNIFNQLYIDNIFKEYNRADLSYIN